MSYNNSSLAHWALLILGCFTNGCASFLPYEDDFACKNEDHGQCIHPEAAYREAVTETAPDAGFREVNHSQKKKRRAARSTRLGGRRVRWLSGSCL
ncbi:MAG: TraV family lipoprotein [Pseudomonadota bacterium]